MDALSFAFWLHGFDEISGGTVPNATQWAIIQDHLKLVIGPSPLVAHDGYQPFSSPKDMKICTRIDCNLKTPHPDLYHISGC